MWKDAKYLIAYVAPISAFAGIYLGGAWSLGAVYVGFVLIPLFELFVPASPQNLSTEQEDIQTGKRFFDLLLYLNLPILYGLIAFLVYRLTSTPLTTFEMIAMAASVGVINGTAGINVAHELGHRPGRFDQLVAKLLLVPSLYTHFTIEHNWGHHKNVGTPEDPATARLGENVYAFWVRSVAGNFVNAWKLEFRRLERLGLPRYHLTNEMLWNILLQLAYLGILWFAGGVLAVGCGIGAAVLGFLLLECVNYIEHYGLFRQKLASGKYENVLPRHSWNSDHEIGRIFLYELTRHSDHHYKATRKYQVLRHMEESPQLPYGYPGSILISLLPPLWFRIMDGRVRLTNA